jgi:hypothetical protein
LETAIGVILGPNFVACVRVDHRCDADLFDAAIEAGYFVLGMPRCQIPKKKESE